MSLPSVLLIFNEPVLPADHPDAASEHDVLETADFVVKVLGDAGFPIRRLGFSHDPRVLLDELRENPPEVVFNMFEGLATQTGTEISVAALLEWMNVPFTGTSSLGIVLGRDKIRTKQLLQGAGIPTPEFLVIERSPAPQWPFAWPVIVKPALQDASVGIDQGSVVTDQKKLDERVAHILERYGPPILAERFIRGREFHASIIEEPSTGAPLLVPLAEIRFQHEPDRHWPIYTYTAKWAVDSPEYNNTPLEAPVYLAPTLMERIEEVAIRTFELIGLRDYGRIDLRLTDDGIPYVLEANPNPYISNILLIKGLEAMGRSHTKFVEDLIWAAWRRSSHAKSLL
jgi:D-alanine-D-alanine ligase